ncbi:FtsW/RodA/SpoVE family cell cycle protein [Dietzia sp. SLG310A2-38A2]|uniref:FtsW/RodA/SpoVE family cell cycle protein n=1 Tax=Dietzia sp. SLG310A2-38A2 TaxID=1630643 RepID=UPI0015FD5401|nr:FtsW/RodA/SpoVE family cell cycle protein [Dietzia sp. SLG310A2-38A2]
MAAPAPAPGTQAAPAPPRRGKELVLLVAASVIVGFALLLVQLAQEQELSLTLLWLTLAYLGLCGGAHLVIRWLAPFSDPVLLPAVALLNGLGLVLIYRLDLAYAARAVANGTDPPGMDVTRQLLWTLIGLAFMAAVLYFLRDHRVLSRYGYTMGFAGLVLLAIPAVLPARFSEINGAKNWIILPGFTIQPGEFAKILLIIFFASILVEKRELFTSAGRRILGVDLPRGRDLGPIIVAWFLSLGVLVFNTDLGMALLLFATVLTMLYVATERVSWLLIGVVLVGIGGVLAYALFGHVRVRFQIWQDPFAYFDTGGYQSSQALFGLASGGMGGTGLGNGRPDQVPFAGTDFITSTIGEELGLIGLAAVLMIYAIIVLRGIRVGLTIRDSFGKLVAVGLAFTVAIQVFVVVGGVSTLIPLTGLTLPFMAYGGSSLLANYALLAILLRLSNDARRPLPTPRQAPALADAATGMMRTPLLSRVRKSG